jgi:hypothetical protein
MRGGKNISLGGRGQNCPTAFFGRAPRTRGVTSDWRNYMNYRNYQIYY